jgi:hypothetical protein
VQLATFSYTTDPPQTSFTIEFFPGWNSSEPPAQPPLASGTYVLEDKTLAYDPVPEGLASLWWRLRRVGVFDYSGTFTIAFPAHAHLVPGSKLTMWFGPPGHPTWFSSWYTVDACPIDEITAL